MRMTERDQRVLRWVNGAGYVTLTQLSAYMGVDFSTTARRARLLCEGGLLSRLTLPMSTQTVLLPTRTACSVIGDDLVPLTGIRIASSRHDSALVDCSRALEQRFQMRFEAERRLRQRRFSIGKHLPDGLLHQPEGLPIAVELELSCKSIARLTEIFDAYDTTLEIEEVWYIVIDDLVEAHLKRVIGNRSGIKIRRWRPSAIRRETTEAV